MAGRTQGTTPDVAIIGGGIVGTAAASFLADAGLGVRLYERSAIAAGASGRNSGIVQQPFDPVLAALHRTSLVEYRVLAAAGVRFDFPRAPAGLLYVGHDARIAADKADGWRAAWPATRPEVVVGAALRELEPALAPDIAACRLEIGYPVTPAAATHAYAALASRLGVATVIGQARPALDHGRVAGVHLAGRLEPAGVVLVCAGPWTPALVDPGGGWRPIRPVWGVVASLALAAAPRHALEAIDIAIEPADDAGFTVRDGGHDSTRAAEPSDAGVEFSLVPAVGASALGSTFLAAEPEPGAWLDALRRVGARYVPAIAAAPLIGLRHCARPVSADGRPLIGAIADVAGLFVAAGHGPWGISTGPGSARLVTDLILDRIRAGEMPNALDPGRFSARTRKARRSSRRSG